MTNNSRLYPSTGPVISAKSNGWNVLNPIQQAQNGGSCSNNGIPYPNGLAGNAYSFTNNQLPGGGIQGNNNHYSLNTKPTLQTEILKLQGGKRRRRRSRKRSLRKTKKNYRQIGCCSRKKKACSCPCCKKKRKNRTPKRKYKGGAFTNSILSSAINTGRQISYGVNSTYNAMNGYPAPTNPTPWIGQLPNSSLSVKY